MKIIKILASILVFIIGIMIGIWFGVENVYVEVETIPTKTTIDIITFIATIIGAAATLLGFILALYVSYSWKKQQVDQAVIDSKLKLVKLICETDLAVARYLITKGQESLDPPLIALYVHMRSHIALDKSTQTGKDLTSSLLGIGSPTMMKETIKLYKQVELLNKIKANINFNSDGKIIFLTNGLTASFKDIEHLRVKYEENKPYSTGDLITYYRDLADKAVISINSSLKI